MDVLKNINLALRFGLELCMLAAYGWWGYHSGIGTFKGVSLAILLPLAVAIIWGLFLSPKAKVKLQISVRVAMELILFGVAAWLLYNAGMVAAGSALFITFVVNRAILVLLKY